MTITEGRPGGPADVRLGLRENWPQFALLVIVNFLVGGTGYGNDAKGDERDDTRAQAPAR